MVRTADPQVRLALIERAAEMLARREVVTLRALVDSVGSSTMAVYTHFQGMPGLWRAVRQEGFTRLARHLARVEVSSDPVRDLMALGAAYVANAMANPFLYRAMFDAAAELEDPEAAGAGFQLLVAAAERARTAGRFASSSDPEAVATQLWATGHGLVMLVLTGVLPREVLAPYSTSTASALFVAAGDDADRCRRSVTQGWALGEVEAGGDNDGSGSEGLGNTNVGSSGSASDGSGNFGAGTLQLPDTPCSPNRDESPG